MIDLAPCATTHSICVNVAHHCFCFSTQLHGVLDDACRLNDTFLLTSSPCHFLHILFVLHFFILLHILLFISLFHLYLYAPACVVLLLINFYNFFALSTERT